MLSKEQVKAIESSLKLAAGTLQSAIDSTETVNIELPKLVVRTEAQEQELKTQIKLDEKKKYDAGVEVGDKKFVNEIAKTQGINLEGKAKTTENLLQALKDKINSESSQPKEQRITELENDLEVVRGKLEATEGEYNTFKAQVDTENLNRTIDSNIMGVMGDLSSDNLVMDKNRILTLAKAEYRFAIEDGAEIVYKGDEIIKSESTRKPLTHKEHMAEYVKQFAKGHNPGRSNGDRTGKSTASMTIDEKYELAKSTVLASNPELVEGSADYARIMQQQMESYAE